MNNSDFEIELEKHYTTLLVDWGMMSLSEAIIEVRKAIKACREQGIKEGTADLREDLGDCLINNENSLPPGPKRAIDRARDDGATDDDIKEYWNLLDLVRRMITWSENMFRYATFLAFKEDGLTSDEAMIRVRKMFPHYGHPDDDKGHTSGADRRLPDELRGRVDKYREQWGARHISHMVKKYSTYNAFIRSEIGAGNL